MQPQYSQGAAPSHHPPPYAPPEVSQASGGSITSSLRQWRKKDYVEKQQSTTEQPSTSVAENPSHVARVAPHTYYPRLNNDVCHYQHQYSEYSGPYKPPPVPAPVKYSEIVDTPQPQSIEHIAPVLPKHKDKEYGDLCNIPPQPHIKQYQDQMSLKQPYPDSAKQTYVEANVHHQYISKDSQMNPFLQKQAPMHQYIQKEPYQQYIQKYGMQGQFSQSYTSSEPNNFLAHLNKINPRMAQSIINDTHLRDPQISPMYHSIEQNRSYPSQPPPPPPQRMYHSQAMHSSPTHGHRNISQPYNYPQPYNYNVKSNMQPNDPYNRVHQYQHNIPKYLPEYKMNPPMEQPIPNISPHQRVYNENVHMNYAPMPPKISPNYPHCSQLEYAQHYQHRRAQMNQEYYPHSAYKATYVQNPQVSPENGGSDSRARKSSLKQYLETWVEEDMAGNLPDIIISNNLSDVENVENLKGTMCIKGSDTQEQPLYVLDTTEIPNENLPHFLHLQQIEKLPDNIRGYYHSANAMPPGSRRIIIENSNALECSPENSQIVRGNPPSIVSKIPEMFSENGNILTIENENTMEGPQRKIITTDGSSEKIGRVIENQIPNLENKVVQIHIIEDTGAATTNNTILSSDISSPLNNHPRSNASSVSDTVIMQSSLYQQNPPHPDHFTKIVTDVESCALRKQMSHCDKEEKEEDNEEEIEQDKTKNMPVIDEAQGENLIHSGEIAATSSDIVQEQSFELNSENLNPRRASICNIYREMEHIHRESLNNNNNFECNKHEKTENNNLSASQLENCNILNSNNNNNSDNSDRKETKEFCDDERLSHSPIVEKSEELNAKDIHSQMNSEMLKQSDYSLNDSTTDLIDNVANNGILLEISQDESDLSKTENRDESSKEIVLITNEVNKENIILNQEQEDNKEEEMKNTLDDDNNNSNNISKEIPLDENDEKSIQQIEIDQISATDLSNSNAEQVQVKNEKPDSPQEETTIEINLNDPGGKVEVNSDKTERVCDFTDNVPMVQPNIEEDITENEHIIELINTENNTVIDCLKSGDHTIFLDDSRSENFLEEINTESYMQSAKPLNLSKDKLWDEEEKESNEDVLALENSLTDQILNNSFKEMDENRCVTNEIENILHSPVDNSKDNEVGVIKSSTNELSENETNSKIESIISNNNKAEIVKELETNSIDEENVKTVNVFAEDTEMQEISKNEQSSDDDDDDDDDEEEEEVKGSENNNRQAAEELKNPSNDEKEMQCNTEESSNLPFKNQILEEKNREESDGSSSESVGSIPEITNISEMQSINTEGASDDSSEAVMPVLECMVNNQHPENCHVDILESKSKSNNTLNPQEKKPMKIASRKRNKTKTSSATSENISDGRKKSRWLNKTSKEKNNEIVIKNPVIEETVPIPETKDDSLHINKPDQMNACDDTKESSLSSESNAESSNELSQIREYLQASLNREPSPVDEEQEGEGVNLLENNQEEETEDASGVVYQINNNNVVLQIADELLEINVVAQNGRKIILVKTFSDAIIMNNSDEDNLQTYEDALQNTIQSEDENLKNAVPLPPPTPPPLNNMVNEDAENICLKESDITTVGDEVCIYNEEIVSSSTELQTVPNAPIVNEKEKKMESTKIEDKNNSQENHVTRKRKKEKKVSWEDQQTNKTKCLTDDSQKPTETMKTDVSDDTKKPATTIKDCLRKSPKTKAALKFLETDQKVDTKVPLKTTPTTRTEDSTNISDQNNKTAKINIVSTEKKSCKSLKKHQTNLKDESTTVKQKSIQDNKKIEKTEKIRNKSPNKDSERVKDSKKKVQVKYSKDDNRNNKSSSLKKLSGEQQQKSKMQYQKATTKTKSEDAKSNKRGFKDTTNSEKRRSKEPETKKLKATKSSEKQKKNNSSSQEKQVSVQENRITSSTSQENETLNKERNNKLIQQINDDWDDDDPEDLKLTVTGNSCKRRLSLQEYNSRKRTSSTAEQETTQTDLTSNLWNSGLISVNNKINTELSPGSPVLNVNFNNKTYSRCSNYVNTSKPSAIISNNLNCDLDIGTRESSSGSGSGSTSTNNLTDYKNEESLSSAIGLNLPKTSRSLKPAYNPKYLRSALINDLQAVRAYTTNLVKENQQIMQRFLEQKHLAPEELKKVKTIIRYKRLLQHLSTLQINETQNIKENQEILKPTLPTTNLSLEINQRQSGINRLVNLPANLQMPVRIPEKRKRKRFRFLYSDDESESNRNNRSNNNNNNDGDLPAHCSNSLVDNDSKDYFLNKRPRLEHPVPTLESKVMDYSVHQSNSQGQLTLVFKRSFKSDPRMQPFVKLERIPSIDLLAKNRLH